MLERGPARRHALVARLTLGRTALAQRHWDTATRHFDRVIGDARQGDEPLLARAYLGAARSHLRDGGEHADRDAALRAALKVVVLYPDQTREQPAALALAARCLRELARDAADPRSHRARELVAELRRRFPDSPYNRQR